MKEYITSKDFLCKCGKCSPSPEVMKNVEISKKMFNLARIKAGIPFNFNSYIRCTEHNKDEGGGDNSSHLYGYAGDVRCSNDAYRFLIVSSLIAVGFKRIGINKNFIHADNDPSKPQCIWVY